ncbi:MAG TPA: MFS transporter [Ktedonobacterales bacterium]
METERIEEASQARPEAPTLEGMAESPPPATPARGGASLWRNRDFNVFWTGQTLSAVGDAFAVIALPLLVLQATGSVAQMGLVTATFGGGQFLAGLFAGPLVDRVDRRKLMLGCDVGRALLYAAIPLGWWLLGPRLWLVYVVVGLASMLSMCFSVAYVTAIPNLVDRERIIDANGRLQSTLALGWVIGPMLAGVISARTGPALAVGVDAVSFVISALSLLGIRLRQAAATPPPRGEEAKGKLHEMLAGIRFLLRERVLRWVMVLFACGSLLLAGGNDLFIYHIKHDLHQGDAAVGVLFGAASVGGVLGAVMAPRLRRWLGFGPSWLGGWALSGLLIAAIGVVPQVSVAAVLAMVFVYFNNIAGINGMTIRQQITPDHLLGRVTSAYFTVGMALSPIGAAAVTAFAARFGAPLVLAAMGLSVTALALLGALTPSRERRPERRAVLYAPVAAEVSAPPHETPAA